MYKDTFCCNGLRFEKFKKGWNNLKSKGLRLENFERELRFERFDKGWSLIVPKKVQGLKFKSFVKCLRYNCSNFAQCYIKQHIHCWKHWWYWWTIYIWNFDHKPHGHHFGCGECVFWTWQPIWIWGYQLGNYTIKLEFVREFFFYEWWFICKYCQPTNVAMYCL